MSPVRGDTPSIQEPHLSEIPMRNHLRHGPDRTLVLWKSRCTERRLMAWDPRGFRKEALMRCMQEEPS